MRIFTLQIVAILLMVSLPACTKNPNERFSLSEIDRFNSECSADLSLPIGEAILVQRLKKLGLSSYRSTQVEDQLESGDGVFPAMKGQFPTSQLPKYAIVTTCGSVKEGIAFSRLRRYAFYVGADGLIRHVEEKSLLSLRKSIR
jgi:hypothetical protein